MRDKIVSAGYELVKTKGLGALGWHAEGRLMQHGININDRIVAMGVSDKMCISCAADVDKFGIRTLNDRYGPEYKRLPQKRPSDECL